MGCQVSKNPQLKYKNNSKKQNDYTKIKRENQKNKTFIENYKTKNQNLQQQHIPFSCAEYTLQNTQIIKIEPCFNKQQQQNFMEIIHENIEKNNNENQLQHLAVSQESPQRFYDSIQLYKSKQKDEVSEASNPEKSQKISMKSTQNEIIIADTMEISLSQRNNLNNLKKAIQDQLVKQSSIDQLLSLTQGKDENKIQYISKLKKQHLIEGKIYYMPLKGQEKKQRIKQMESISTNYQTNTFSSFDHLEKSNNALESPPKASLKVPSLQKNRNCKNKIDQEQEQQDSQRKSSIFKTQHAIQLQQVQHNNISNNTDQYQYQSIPAKQKGGYFNSNLKGKLLERQRQRQLKKMMLQKGSVSARGEQRELTSREHIKYI